ncbi:MAG TPA: UDP-N-acetylmuramoyl-L-alanine--D-glutamate ligase [Firmicutes bacterium]|nr:UDP-N-acetylmuramoyl-L-alanine--D-glutamate ligase [Bacillota bacterium]
MPGGGNGLQSPGLHAMGFVLQPGLPTVNSPRGCGAANLAMLEAFRGIPENALTQRQREVISRLKGKRISVLGLGVSNLAVIPFLVAAGAKVIACDRKPSEALQQELNSLRGLPVEFRLGQHYLDDLDSSDAMVVTPGMPKDLPELVHARDHGVSETSEIKLFFELCESFVIGITGSDGKTTTTTITGLTMKAAGRDVFVGGNIGTPLLNRVFDMRPDSVAVLELSSFQLQPLQVSPQVGAVLNVYPNHLDHHRSMEEYIEAKANIFLHQGPGDAAVFNADNPISREMALRCPSEAVFFSRLGDVDNGAFLRDDEIWVRLRGKEQAACSRGDIRIPGEHNVENVLAAAAITGLAGVPFAAFREAITGFTGVEHRLELVGERGGVRFYNDSIATSPSRAIAGIKSFREPIVLIAGGYDKNLPFDDFASAAAERTRAVVLIGDTAPKIEAAIRAAGEHLGRMPVLIRASHLREAVEDAFEIAEEGDVVLLSPACASFDMFPDYKARGRQFKEIVRKLVEGGAGVVSDHN